MRVLFGLVGLAALWTGVYAFLNFSPPLGADPGAVNACYLTFAVMVTMGPAFIWGAIRY